MSGLEVVGSIASVAQLAGTVYAISKTLYEVGNALSNAPSDIKDLAGDLENFSEELHLYARLLDKKHYDDQFHRLTARIIGECATICMKIDRVLRKLRSGSVWARVKWLYKEKEIVKLLTRLRDLKFSLLNILQLMKYLKADYEIDAIGGPNRSLIEGSKEEGLSKETVAQVEATRKKLAGISIAQEHDAGESRPEEKPVTHSNEKLPQSVGDAKPRSSQSIETLSGQTLIHTPSQTSELEAKASAAPSEVLSSSHITAVALPATSIMQNPNLSVQSFHSAVSHMEPDHGDETIAGYYNPELAMRADDGQVRPKASIGNENANNLKADFVSSAMKHLEMSQEVAEAWAAASVARVPGMSRSGFRRQRHPAPGRGLDQPQSPQQSMQHGAGPSTSLASALIPGPQPDPQRRASTLEPSTSLEQSASLHHVDYPINSLAVPTMYDNKNLPSSSSTNMGTVSQDSPVRSPRAFAPNSTSFTNLTSPSAYSESPEYNGDFDASPHVNIGNAQFSGDPWYPLFPNEELEVSEPLRASSRRRSSTAGSPPGSHSSISVVNSRKHDKPLPPIIVDDPNDTIAMKRARNTLAARKYRQRKMQKMEELEDEHDTSPYVNRDDTQDNDQSGPKPTKGGSSRVPGAFDDDLELTAGLQATGFDPNIVIKDPTFQRRDSPPRSNAPLSNKRSASQAQLHESDSYTATSPPSTRRSVGFEQMNPGSFSGTITDLPNQNNFSRSAASAFVELGFESGDGQSFNYTSPAPQLPLLRISKECYIPSLSYTQDDSPWCSKSQQMVPPEINIEFAPASRTNSFEPPKPSLDTDDLTLSAPRRRSRAMSDPYSSSPIDPSTLSTSSKTRSNEPPENLPLPSTHSRRSSASSIPNRDHIIVLADPQHQNATLDDWNLNKRAQKHPSTFQCALCPQTFSRSYNLRSHIKTHYGGAYDGSTTASSPQKPPPAPPSFKLWYPELPKSLWPGVFKLLARNDQSPSPQQLKELWWRAVAKLSVEDESSCKHIHGAWLAARRYHNDVTTLKAMDPTNADGDIARTSAGVLEECSSRVSDSGARSWLHRIGEILKVMRSSLDFKIGGFVWTCFCQVTIWLIHRHLGEFPDQSSTFATLADLATLIARYNVMESMYHEWPGMSLEKKYEDSLINLCTSVLQYLDKVMQVQPWLSSEPAENLASHAVRIAEADAACRGFTVTIVPEAVQSGTKRTLEIGEDEEDSDSDSTVVDHGLGLIPSPKRVKV